eukprot:evm.model.scf_876.4 EVM.evm.TU.scf_876.4   scf_876:19566-22779(-)
MLGGSVVLVLVAHNGRTLQLGSVQPETRVDAVQEVLEELASIPVGEQIVMCRGVRLDPKKPLSLYSLPADGEAAAEDNPVFLYSRAFIRPGAPLQPPASFEEMEVKVPPMGCISVEHPLHASPSPLVRALPDYELQFQHDLLVAQETWDVSQKYLRRCQQLLSEQEVQSRAIDAARANVQTHFNAISRGFTEFLARYRAQHCRHSEVLSTVGRDFEQLGSTAIHQDLRTDKWRRLCDLVPQKQLREWADGCSRAHARFGDKVADLEGLFASLKSDVESLFMQAPTVDLDDLGATLEEKEQLLEEEGSIIQVLSKDMRTVRALVETTVRQLGTERLGTSTAHDACGAMESMSESHMQRLVPRLKDCNACLASFCQNCVGYKNRMTRDVAHQLQSISKQQSRILEMKNKLAAFKEVAAKQDDACAELMVVHRIPAAYKASLAECVRRRAWSQIYCGQVSRLAEHMGKVRLKEVQKREKFQRHVEGYLPSEMLVKMGLFLQPSHCQISVPPEDGSLLAVSVEDLQNLPSASSAPGLQVPSSLLPLQSDVPDIDETCSSEHEESDEVEDPFSAEASHIQRLEMENSKLRADYAAQVAYQSMKEAEDMLKVCQGEGVEEGAKEKREQGVVSKLKEALQAWESVNSKLESEVAVSRKQNHVYEDRIRELEERVADLSGSQHTREESSCIVQLHVSIAAEPNDADMPQGGDVDRVEELEDPAPGSRLFISQQRNYAPGGTESASCNRQSPMERPATSDNEVHTLLPRATPAAEGIPEVIASNCEGQATSSPNCSAHIEEFGSFPVESDSLLGMRSHSPATNLRSSATDSQYQSVPSVADDSTHAEGADTGQEAADRPLSPDGSASVGSVPEILSHSSGDTAELVHQSVQDVSKVYEGLESFRMDTEGAKLGYTGGPSEVD